MGLRCGRPLGWHTAFLAVCTITAAMCAALAGRAPTARAGGVGENSLQLSVTVNTRPGLGAVRPGIRAGAPVVKVYRLTNRSGADLSSVRLADPAVAPALLRCDGGSGNPGTLRALSSTTCTARFPAAPGPHTGWVAATGEVPSLGIRMTATAHSGYAGVAGRLSLTESALLTSFNEAEVRYVLTNPGNRTVYDVQVADAELAPGRIDCPGGANVPQLPPGASATCTARVVRPPGTYRSAGLATGSDWTVTLGPTGGDEAPPVLTANATLSFGIPTPPVLPPAALAPAFPLRPAFPFPPRSPQRQQTPPLTGRGSGPPLRAPGTGETGRTPGTGGTDRTPTTGGAPGSAAALVPAAPPAGGALPGQPSGAAPRNLLALPPFYTAPMTPPGPPGPFAPEANPAAPLFGEGGAGAAPAPAQGATAGAAPVLPGTGAGGTVAGGTGPGGTGPGGTGAGGTGAEPPGGGGTAGAAPAAPGGGAAGVAPALPGGGTAGAAPVAPGGGAAGVAPVPPGGGIAGAVPVPPGGGTAGVTPPRPPAPVAPTRPRPPRTNESRGEEASVLARVRRKSREVSGLSVVAVLLLLLIPAALAAALMGSRRP